MAEAVVSFVIERIGNFSIQEAKFLYGVRDQVEDAQTELQLIQGFLKDADARQGEDARVAIWVAKIRDAAYDLEDVIETYGLKVASARNGGEKNVLKRFGCIILIKGVHLYRIGAEIEKITSKISNLRLSMQNYSITRERREIGGSSSLQSCERQQQLRRSYSHVIERDVVGIEGNVKEVVIHLVNLNNCHRVVSIWGMGGSGKTTLAKQVYHHKEVRHHFDSFAWVCVSQRCEVRNVWEGILIKLIFATNEQRQEIKEMRDDEIAKKLFLVQQERRCLVILDDIWSVQTWNSLKVAFPLYEETQSRILLTTRNKTIALHADKNGFLHRPQALNEDESWELFEKIAIFGRVDLDFAVYTQMKQLGKKMLRHCNGLPLAITVLAGVLARKSTINEWGTVHGNVYAYIRRGIGHDEQEYAGASWVLALSYDDLPYLLKPCLLYLGHYPEDSEIPVKRLTQLWMAEGLIPLTQQGQGFGETMEDIAYKCLSELVERCVVQVGERGSIRKIKTCRVHDLIRDLCLLKAEEENFIQVVNFLHKSEATNPFSSSIVAKAASLGKVRRLAIYLDENCDKLVPSKDGGGGGGHLRSLLYFGPSGSGEWFPKSKKLIAAGFKDFKFLRVLKVEGLCGEVKVELPSEIGNMVHLRFLSLRDSKIISFPAFLGNLICLQTLDFRVQNYRPLIPNVIWKMKQLRHLYLPFDYRVSGKMQLSTLCNLQTLYCLSSEYCDLNDLAGLNNLKKLVITLSNPFEKLEETLKSTGSTLDRVRSLFVETDYGIDGCAEQVTQIVSSCRHIYKLMLDGPISELPKELPNLTKLELSGCDLKDDQMGILENLPNLTTLRFDYRTFKGNTKILVFSKQGFPHLQFLFLSFMAETIEWRVEEGAMPSLRRLCISGSIGLTALPEGLRYLTNLRELIIEGMPSTFHSKIQKGGEDFYKIQHVHSIIGEPYDAPQNFSTL